MKALDFQHGGIDILRGSVLDVSRSIGIVQRRQRFRGVAIRGRYTGQEQGLTIPTQRILQQSSELALPVRHVLGLATLGQSLLVGKGVDDIAQRQEPFIDFDPLSRTLAFRARLLHSLTTSKVHKGEARGGGNVDARFLVPHGLMQMDGEDGMRATALMIHQRRRRRAVESSDVQNIERLRGGGYRPSFETNDTDAAGPILSEGKGLAILVEKVVYVLSVYLEEGCRYVVVNELAGGGRRTITAAILAPFRLIVLANLGRRLGRGNRRRRRLGGRPSLLLFEAGENIRHETRD